MRWVQHTHVPYTFGLLPNPLKRFRIEGGWVSRECITWRGFQAVEQVEVASISGLTSSEAGFIQGGLNHGELELWTGNRKYRFERVRNKRAFLEAIEVARRGDSIPNPGPSPSSDPVETPTPPKSRPLRFPDSEELRRHREMLSVLAAEGESPARSRPASSYSVTVEREWDGSHEAPASEPSTVLPGLVSWAPDGSRFITTCGAWGASVWDRRGKLIGSHRPESSYGAGAYSALWSPGGEHCLVFSRSNLHKYVQLYSRGGALLGSGPLASIEKEGVTSELFPGWLSSADRERLAGVSPWRPGKPIFVTDHAAELLGIDLGGVSGSGGSSPESLEMTPRAGIDFTSPDLSQDTCVMTCWHPGGAYLAATRAPEKESGPAGRVTRIVHFESGDVLASVPGSTAVRWSPEGRRLLLNVDGQDLHSHGRWKPVEEARVWDSREFEVRELTDEEREASWVLRSLRSTRFEHWNSDATLKVETGSGAPHLSTLDDSVAELESVTDFDWSPTDPGCLVTLKGRQVEILRVSPA